MDHTKALEIMKRKGIIKYDGEASADTGSIDLLMVNQRENSGIVALTEKIFMGGFCGAATPRVTGLYLINGKKGTAKNIRRLSYDGLDYKAK